MVKAQKKNKQYEKIIKEIDEIKDIGIRLCDEKANRNEVIRLCDKIGNTATKTEVTSLNNKIEDAFIRMNESLNVLSVRLKNTLDDEVISNTELRLNLYKHIATCGLIAFISLLFFLYNF